MLNINAQNLNLKLIVQLTNISFVDIDDVMINGYGFEKMKEDENGQKHYMKIYNDDYDSAILITITDAANFSRNLLDIKVAKKYSLRKIKDDLVQDGFLYGGTNEYGLTVYQKEDVYFLIANEPNDVGATQIIVMYEQ